MCIRKTKKILQNNTLFLMLLIGIIDILTLGHMEGKEMFYSIIISIHFMDICTSHCPTHHVYTATRHLCTSLI